MSYKFQKLLDYIESFKDEDWLKTDIDCYPIPISKLMHSGTKLYKQSLKILGLLTEEEYNSYHTNYNNYKQYLIEAIKIAQNRVQSKNFNTKLQDLIKE